MEIDVRTEQIKVLEDFFENLGTMDQRKIFTSAFKKASKPLISAMKGRVPTGHTGNLRASIGALMEPKEIAILVGARRGGSYDGWYGHFVEHGTKERIRKNGGSTGKVVGRHFVENAYNATERQIADVMEQEWYQAIDRFIISTNKKAK